MHFMESPEQGCQIPVFAFSKVGNTLVDNQPKEKGQEQDWHTRKDVQFSIHSVHLYQ